MRSASEIRKLERDALRGNWKTAILTGFVVSLIGAGIATGGGGGSSTGGDDSSGAFFAV